MMCRVRAVSRSGYDAWRERLPSAREMANQRRLEEIKAGHKKSRSRYGSPRIYQALLQLEIRCSGKRVARLMRQNGIRGQSRRRYKRTTDANHAQPVAPNRLQQDFQTRNGAQILPTSPRVKAGAPWRSSSTATPA